MWRVSFVIYYFYWFVLLINKFYVMLCSFSFLTLSCPVFSHPIPFRHIPSRRIQSRPVLYYLILSYFIYKYILTHTHIHTHTHTHKRFDTKTFFTQLRSLNCKIGCALYIFNTQVTSLSLYFNWTTRTLYI